MSVLLSGCLEFEDELWLWLLLAALLSGFSSGERTLGDSWSDGGF